MKQPSLPDLPEDLIAAIVLRAFASCGATLLAREDLGLVCKAWHSALAGCEVNHEFRGRVGTAQRDWLASTVTRLASLTFAPAGGCGTDVDPGSAQLLMDPAVLAASVGSLATVRNLVVPLTAVGLAALRRLGERFHALRELGIVIDTICKPEPGFAAGAAPHVRLAEVLRAVPATVRELELTFLVDMFVALEGMWLGHLHALRRLRLSGPGLEALFCDVEGMPAGLEEVSVSVPQGEVTVILDNGLNCLSQPLKGHGCSSDDSGDARSTATAILTRESADGQRKGLRLTITDAKRCTSRLTVSEEDSEDSDTLARRQRCKTLHAPA